MTLKANNPRLTSWINVDPSSDFSIQNLPFGVFKTQGSKPRLASAIGEYVIDLAALSEHGFLKGLEIKHKVFEKKYLNSLISSGRPVWRALRERLSEIFQAENPTLRDDEAARGRILYKMNEVTMLLPVKIGDYTDFYSSIDHATNVGSMFRDPANALLPNWKHLPVGYHGRASSIIVSGEAIHRPKGQTKPADSEYPVYGPTRLLDFELETAFIIGKQTKLGKSISTSEAEDHIFGMVLFNDWSARDIQTWEYVPLGPFLAKNFASSMSPWVVTMDALEPFRVKGYEQEPKVLPYLEYAGNKNIDINLEVLIEPEGAAPTTVSSSNYKFMYWTMEQQLAHHTVNGCNVNIGDVMASGTISGPTPESFGSMLELSWRGTKPLKMSDGSERKFINDNDTVIMKGHAQKNGVRVGFGEVRTKVLPAI